MMSKDDAGLAMIRVATGQDGSGKMGKAERK